MKKFLLAFSVVSLGLMTVRADYTNFITIPTTGSFWWSTNIPPRSTVTAAEAWGAMNENWRRSSNALAQVPTTNGLATTSYVDASGLAGTNYAKSTTNTVPSTNWVSGLVNGSSNTGIATNISARTLAGLVPWTSYTTTMKVTNVFAVPFASTNYIPYVLVPSLIQALDTNQVATSASGFGLVKRTNQFEFTVTFSGTKTLCMYWTVTGWLQ